MRSLGLLIFVSLSVAACAEETVAGRSSGGGGGGGGGGAAAENCLDGVDNDLDGSIDCADSDCGAAGACQGFNDTGVQDTGTTDTGAQDTGVQDTGSADTGAQDTGNPDTGPQPQPENCFDGVDNDRDGDSDCNDNACFGDAACNYTCGYTYSVCEGEYACDSFGDCVYPFGQSYFISVEFIEMLGNWDIGGVPDPQVDVFLNGSRVIETPEYPNTTAAYPGVGVIAYVAAGSTIQIMAYDKDVTDYELAYDSGVQTISPGSILYGGYASDGSTTVQLSFSPQ